jgi:hypothetical protein
LEVKLTISPDGSLLTGLYTDKFDWQNLGDLEIVRATDVRFDKEKQGWAVHILDEQDRPLPEIFNKRRDAIDAEMKYLNERGIL